MYCRLQFQEDYNTHGSSQVDPPSLMDSRDMQVFKASISFVSSLSI